MNAPDTSREKTEKAGERPDLPPKVVAEWWTPFAEHLALERRCSPYTVRNYRQALEDFYRWASAEKV